MAEFLRERARSDDEESEASGASRGKKRRITCTTPDVPEDLAIETRTSSVADIGAELMRRVGKITKVTTTSSNLKGTYIKLLKDAASSIVAGTMELTKRAGPACGTGAARVTEAHLAILEGENAVLRKELARRPVCALQESTRCGVSTSESGRTLKDGEGKSERLSALERKNEEIGPSIMILEERLEDLRISPESRHRERREKIRAVEGGHVAVGG
jgi:hypothetical protein